MEPQYDSLAPSATNSSATLESKQCGQFGFGPGDLPRRPWLAQELRRISELRRTYDTIFGGVVVPVAPIDPESVDL